MSTAGGSRGLTLRVGVEPHFRDGLRITDALIMEVIEMVLARKVNKNLVSLINIAEEPLSASATSSRASLRWCSLALCLFLYVIVSFLFLYLLVPRKKMMIFTKMSLIAWKV